MSRIVTTQFGRFRQVTDKGKSWFLWECPRCERWGGLSDAQWAGTISVACDCGYHETHAFGLELVAVMQSRILTGDPPADPEDDIRESTGGGKLMGLDLRLLPYDYDAPHISFSHTILNCDRQYDLFDPIQEIEKQRGRKVVDDFNTFLSRDDKYEETHYGQTVVTPYGDPLKEVEVEDLLQLKEIADRNKHNKAIWAYLAELPVQTKVALYWC